MLISGKIQAQKRKGVKNMLYATSKEAYELKLIDEIAHSKISWSSILKAIQLAALTNA